MSTKNEVIFSANLEESLNRVKSSYDSREMHLKKVNDLLHLCLLRGDLPRARKTWCILAGVSGSKRGGKRNIDWKQIWDLGLLLIDGTSYQQKIDYVQGIMFRKPEEVCIFGLSQMQRFTFPQKEVILKEAALWMIRSGRFQEALNELDT
jgi:hypothetical protein